MIIMTIVGHLFKALRRSIGRVFLWFVVMGLIAGIAAEIVAIVVTGGLPNFYADGVALALGLAVGYAAGLTILIWEVFADLFESVEDLGKTVGHDLTSGTAFVEKAIETVERRL